MGFVSSLFGKTKAPNVSPPPSPATRAEPSVLSAGQRASGGGFSSLISTGTGGVQRKAKTKKASLIGSSTS